MRALTRYAIAIGSSLLAIVVTQALGEFLLPMRLFFFWCAVLVTAVVGGMGPALVAIVLSAAGASYVMFHPVGSILVAAPSDYVRLAMFVAFAAALSAAVAMRRRAQQQAVAASRWLSTTLGSIGDAVIATDEQGRVSFMNAVAETMTGWRAAEASGRKIGDVFVIVNEDTRAAVENPVTRVLREGVIVGLANHTVLLRRDGTEVPIEDTAAPIRDKEGTMIGVVLVFHDVSEQRELERARGKAEEELRASELRYRTLVEASPLPQAIWTASPSGRIEWSERWMAITGQTRDALEDGRGLDVVHPADAVRTWERWQSALRDKTYYNDEIRVRVASGRYRWFSIRAVPVRDDDGNVLHWVGSVADIHDRKRLEEHAAFINRATEILSSSLDYEVTLRNLARLCVPALGDWCTIDIAHEGAPYERLVVEHTDPAKAQFAFDVDKRFRPRPEQDPIVQVMTSGRTLMVEEISDDYLAAVTLDHEHLAIARGLGLHSFVIAPIMARGRTLGTLTLVHGESGERYSEDDVPLIEELARRAALAIDNARLFREAQAASQAKDEFLATLSHELRTPLTAISGWAGMLRMGDLDEPTTRTAIETIARSAKAQGELIDDLLDLSRVVAGKLHLDIATLNFAAVIEEVLVAARPASDARRLELTFQASAPVVLVRGDERRLRQIVWNLITNAIKFTEPGGRVAVTLAERDGRARLDVTDSGKGIDPEFLPHVWERFRQADSSTSRAHGGLGLGLAVVRHLVELHGGTVVARSEGAGRGATFTVELPIAQVSARTPETRDARALTTELAGCRVLVVEDEDDTRAMLQTMLAKSGANVATAASVAEAMRVMAEHAFDVVLSDIAMPAADGYELLRQVRAHSSIPVIAISAMSGADDRNRALAAGFADFLRKPVEQNELAAHVVRHFRA